MAGRIKEIHMAQALRRSGLLTEKDYVRAMKRLQKQLGQSIGYR